MGPGMKTPVISAFGLAVFTFLASSADAQTVDVPVRPAKVFTLEASQTTERLRYSALVYPSQETELSFRVSGQVIELPIRGATQVQKGDVIAQLDPRDFETAIAQLQSQRDQSAAQLQALRSGARVEEIAALEAAVAAAQAQVDLARDKAERTRQLAERGVAAQATLDQDEAALNVAEADLQAQREQLLIGQSGGRPEDIAASEAALRGLDTQIQTAKDNLGDATLRAPFEGIIAIRHIENFTNVQAGQAVALLQTLSTVDLVFDVPSSDVPELARTENVQAKVAFSALPEQQFEAELVEFSVQADAATQTYRGRVSVGLPQDVTILPGMIGEIFLTLDRPQTPSLTVPLTAVSARPDGAAFVWIVDPDDASVSRRDVVLGDISGGAVNILEGVAAGEQVVTAGLGQLQDGMTIRPITKIGD